MIKGVYLSEMRLLQELADETIIVICDCFASILIN